MKQNREHIYKIVGNGVQRFEIISESKDSYEVIMPNQIFVIKRGEGYSDKNDAQFDLFLSNMRKGKKLKNYKSSKYYNMYIERCKIDYPEWLI